MFCYVVNSLRYSSGKIESEEKANMVFELACTAGEKAVTLHRINPTDPDDFTLLRHKE